MADLGLLFASIAAFVGVYMILAVSLNLEFGYGGQPNLGKVLFFSIGAYIAGILVARIVAGLAGFQGDVFGPSASQARFLFAESHPAVIIGLFLAALAIGAIAGGAFGYLASFPALRLRGDFLAIVLIAAGEATRIFVYTYEPLAGGAIGILGVPHPFVWLGATAGRVAYALVILGIASVFYLFAERLTASPFGRLLKSIRDDELVANVLGKRTPRVKGTVLVIGSGMAAVAGVLNAFYQQSVLSVDYIPQVTFLALTMVLLGGLANHRGAVAGVLLLTVLDRFTQPPFLAIFGVFWTFPVDLNYLRYIGIGVLIILILRFRPQGLVPERPVPTPVPEESSESAALADGGGPA
ncbi:MAG TPA: branched-chain amino acid ABC transporter permease [Thermoplasmata archaeon]